MITEQKLIESARWQYRAFFRVMAASGVTWNFHVGTQSVFLSQHGATMEVPLPVLLTNIQAMTEETMVNRLSEAWRRAPAWLPNWRPPNVNDGWHVGCPAGETYVTYQGATVKRSRNLRGLLDYGRKSNPVKVETRKDPRVPEGADLRVTYADGATGHAHFRSHGICIDWVRNRRAWRGAEFIHHDGEIGYLTKPGIIAGA